MASYAKHKLVAELPFYLVKKKTKNDWTFNSDHNWVSPLILDYMPYSVSLGFMSDNRC